MKSETLKTFLLRAMVLISVAALWEGAVRFGLTTEFWLSRPTLVLARMIEDGARGDTWVHLAVTLWESVAGFLIGSLMGVLTAFAMVKWRWLYAALDPYFMAIYCLPRVALAPLLIMWFGIGMFAKVVLVISIVFFILFFSTYTGARSVDQDLVNAVRTMGATGGQITRRVVLPWCVPWIFSGLKIASAMALVGAVVGEMLSSQWGVGHLLSSAAGQFDTTGIFAALIELSLTAVLLYGGMQSLERRLLKWQGETTRI